MSNKSNGKTVKAMRTTLKFVCIAILFAMVFGIVFTSDVVNNIGVGIEQPLVSYADANLAVVPNVSGLVDDEGGIDASYLKNGGDTFPNGSGPWESRPFYFTNTTNWSSTMSMAILKSSGGSYSDATVVNTAVDSKDRQYSNSSPNSRKNVQYGVNGNAKGFTVTVNGLTGKILVVLGVHVELPLIIKQLIYDDRYTVQAKVTHKVQMLEYFNRDSTWRMAHYKVAAEPENYQAKDDRFITELGSGYFTDWGNTAENKAKYAEYDYTTSDSYLTPLGPLLEDTEDAYPTSNCNLGYVTLTPNNPNLVATFAGGTDEDAKNPDGYQHLFRVWDMDVRYKITRNADNGPNNAIRNDGAAPKGIFAEATPYRPDTTIDSNWPVNIENNTLLQNALPVDSLYQSGTIPQEQIVLSSYTNTLLKNGFYKTLNVTYQDQYMYFGDGGPGNDPAFAGGIKSIKVTGAQNKNDIVLPVTFKKIISDDGTNETYADEVLNALSLTIKQVTSEVYYAVFNQDVKIGEISINPTRVGSALCKTMDVSYYFLDNIEFNVELEDFSNNKTENKAQFNITCSGIDTEPPKSISFLTKGDGIAAEKVQDVLKWHDKSIYDIMFEAASSDGGYDDATYAWFVRVVRGNSFADFTNEIKNQVDPASVSSILANTTFLTVQGLKNFNKIQCNFKTGEITVPGQLTPVSVPSMTGTGYYSLYFYTIDLAGNASGSVLNLFMKTDYIAPVYDITTTAPNKYFEGDNNKISGSKWSFDPFDITLTVLDKENRKPLDSFSGNYIKFLYEDKLYTLSFNQDGFISLNGYAVKSKTEIGAFDFDFVKFPFKINFVTEEVAQQGDEPAKTVHRIKFVLGQIVDPIQNKVLTVNTSLRFFVGLGDGTQELLEYTDESYRYKKHVDSSSAQERGIKIRIERNNPSNVYVTKQGELVPGLFNLKVYGDYLKNEKAAFLNRNWNTDGILNMQMQVDRGSIIYVAIADANNLSKQYNPDVTYEDTQGNDALLKGIEAIFNGVNVTTLYDIDFAINSLFRNSDAMVLSSTDTSEGRVDLAIPLYVEKYGSGLRNIYIWSANEAGKISEITTGKVLVDTDTYNVKATVSKEIEDYFNSQTGSFKLKPNDIQVYLSKEGFTTPSNTFRRGDNIVFNFTFGSDFVPYALTGKGTFNSKNATTLFANDNLVNGLVQWGNNWKVATESMLFTINDKNQIIMKVDSLEDLTGVITSDGTNKTTGLEFELDVRKRVKFGLSGLGSDGSITAPLNKNGTEAPIWLSYNPALNRSEVTTGIYTGLKVNYAVGGVGSLTNLLPSSEGDYLITAAFDETDPYYVSNEKIIGDGNKGVKFFVVLPKIRIIAKQMAGVYGDSLKFDFEIKNIDGKIIQIDKLHTTKNVGKQNILDCFVIDNPLGVSENRLPVGIYEIGVDKVTLDNWFDSDYAVTFESNTYSVKERQIRDVTYGIKANGKYVQGVSRLYKAENPEIYMYINEDILKDNVANKLDNFTTAAELGQIFLNCDYVETATVDIDGKPTNVYVFKDTLGSLINKVNKNSVPGPYPFSPSTDNFVMGHDFKLTLNSTQNMVVLERPTTTITITEEQFIFVTENLTNKLIYNGNLNYTVDANEDLLDDTGYIEGLTFTLTKVSSSQQDALNKYDVTGVACSDKLIKVEINADASVAVQVVRMNDGIQSDAQYYVYTIQKQIPEIEYESIIYTNGFLMGKDVKNAPAMASVVNVGDMMDKYFDFVVFQKSGTEWVLNKDLFIDVELYMAIKSKPDGNVELGLHNAKIINEPITPQTSSRLYVNGTWQKEAEFYNAETNLTVQVKVIPKTIYVVPQINNKVDGEYGYIYTQNIPNLITSVLVDKNGVKVPSSIVGELSGSFDRALFDNDKFLRYGSEFDEVLDPASNLHYGIVEKEHFEFSNPNYNVVFDANMNVFNETNLPIKSAVINISKLPIEIDINSFNTGNFVSKTYDGTYKYYNPIYSEIFKLERYVFNDSYIGFDIAYCENDTEDKTKYDVIIKNVRIVGNAGNFNLVVTYPDLNSEFRFDANIAIGLNTIHISANDIFVSKEFDGNKLVHAKDVKLPAALANIPYEIIYGEENGIKASQYRTMDVSDSHQIELLHIRLEINPNSNMVELISDPNDIMISELPGAYDLRIQNKKASITKRIVKSTDIKNIIALNKEYDGTSNMELKVEFTDEFKTNVIEVLRKFQNIPDDLGFKLIGNAYNSAGLEISDAHENVHVVISDTVKFSDPSKENFVFDSYLFDVDINNIQENFRDLTANIYKAVLKPYLLNNERPYDGIAKVGNNITTELRVNNEIAGNIVFTEMQLSDKGIINPNVIKNDNAVNKYQHNVLVNVKTITIEEKFKNHINNYILGGYKYDGEKYVFYEQYSAETLSETIEKLSSTENAPQEGITFELLNAYTVLPKLVTIDINNIQMEGNKVGDYTKTYDGTTEAKFILTNADKYVVNNEVSFRINANYNSKDANMVGTTITAQKQISFAKDVEIIPNLDVVGSFDCTNNYEIVNNLSSIVGGTANIKPRKVYADRITLEDVEYDKSCHLTVEGKPEEYTTKYKRENISPSDISEVLWKNGNGSSNEDAKNITGFIGDDIKYIRVYMENLIYDLTAANSVIGSKYASADCKLIFTKQTGVMNYELDTTTTEILGQILKKKVFIDLQPKEANFKTADKIYDGTDIAKKTINEETGELGDYHLADFEPITVEGLDAAALGITDVSVKYATKNAGATSLVFTIMTENQNLYEYINLGKSSIKATIKPKTIYYKLGDIKLQYGDNNIVPKYLLYNSNAGGDTVDYDFDEDGNIINSSSQVVIKNGEMLLPECTAIKENGVITKYRKVNDGSKGNYEFSPIATEANVNASPREIFIYALGQNKELGTPNPKIKLQYSNATDSFDTGFIGYDNEYNVFNVLVGDQYYPVFEATYELFIKPTDEFTGKWFDEKVDDASINDIIYGLRIKCIQYEYEGEGENRTVQLNSDGTPKFQLNSDGTPKYGDLTTFTTPDNHYTVQLRNAVGTKEFLNNVLTVSTPKINLTIKDTLTVDYNGRNQLPNIFNSPIGDNEIKYQITVNAEASENAKASENAEASENAQVIDAGKYTIKAYKTLEGYDKDDLYVYVDSHKEYIDGYPIYTGKDSLNTECTLEIKPAAPIISYDLSDSIKIGDSVDTKKIIFGILHQKNAKGEYVAGDGVNQNVIEDLQGKIDVHLEYKAPNSNTFVKLEKSEFKYAGVYKINMSLDASNLPNFLSEDAMSQTIVESIKVIISKPTIEENLFIEDGKNDYVKSTVISIQAGYEDKLNEVKNNLRVQYLGGNANKYVSNITSVGLYQYRFIIADKDGAYNPNYVVLFEDQTPAKDKDLLISRKTIGNSNQDTSKIQASLKSGKPIGIDYITYNLMVDSSSFKWVEINNYVNNMGGLKDVNSKLTAVIRMESKDGNGNTNTSKVNQQLRDSQDQMTFKVLLPENLKTAKNLQVFYINKDGHLEEMTQYSINDGCITYDLNGVYDLVFVSEEVKELPAYAIALIVIGVLAAVGIAVAISIVTIRSKKEQ